MNQILDYIALLGILIFILKSFRDSENAILVAILIKPIVDTGWDFRIAGFSLIDLYSIYFLFLCYHFLFKRRLFYTLKKSYVVLWLVSHLGVLFMFLSSPMSGLESLVRALFFPLALFVLPYFLIQADGEKQKRLIKFLLIGSLFAAAVSILQGLGFLNSITAAQTKGLTRANGFYHDIVTVRIYIVQGFLALYFAYYTRILKLGSVFTTVIILSLLAGGYFTFSKAFTGIILLGATLFLFTSKNKLKGIFFVSILSMALLIFSNTITESISKMFVEEIQYSEGATSETDKLFAGRGMIWADYLQSFNETDTFTQFLGFHRNVGLTHNEFLRIVILSGLIGLISYVILFFMFIGKATKSLFRNKPLNFIILWCLTMLFIDAISVVWGLYPYYLILIVGFFMAAVQYEDREEYYPSLN